jgi:hypothetical protein
MLYKCYLRKSIVYVPTVGRRGGAYTDIEPVAVVPVTDPANLRHAFLDVIARGNVSVPLIKGTWPPPVVLKYAGVKSWAEFAREASTWNIAEKQDVYQISGYRMHPQGYWVEDADQITKFPPSTSVDVVIDRMIAILQEAARQ